MHYQCALFFDYLRFHFQLQLFDFTLVFHVIFDIPVQFKLHFFEFLFPSSFKCVCDYNQYIQCS